MKRTTSFECLLISLALLGLLAVCFYDVAFQGKTFKVTTGNPQALPFGPYGQENNKLKFYPSTCTDSSVLEEPLYEFIKTSLKNGILPLWNPHQACGYPFIGTIQIGMFFPLNFILYILPNTYALDVQIFLRFLLAGLLTYGFMRTLRCGITPSLGAAIVFMLSGPMVLLQCGFANVDILTPLVLLCFERIIREPTLRNLSFTAIAVSLTCFAGNPEHCFLVNAFCAVYFIFRIFTVRPAVKPIKPSAFLLGACLLAFGLTAIVSLPFLQNWSSEFWHNHPEKIGVMVEGKGIFQEALTNSLFPYFYQDVPITLNYDRVGWLGHHMGIFSIGLAFLGLLALQRQRVNYFFACLAFVILAKSYFDLPIINWIGHLPFFKDVRFHLHTMHLLAFAIAVLSGFGIRFALACRNNAKKALPFTLSVLVYGIYVLSEHRTAHYFSHSLRAVTVGFAVLAVFQILFVIKDKKILNNKLFAVLLVTCIGIELFLYIPRGRVQRFDSFPKVPYMEYINSFPQRFRAYGIFWSLYPNTSSGYAIDDFGIVNGLLPKRYVQFINNFVIENYFKKNFTRSAFWVEPAIFFIQSRPFFDLLNVKYVIAHKEISRLFPTIDKISFSPAAYSQEANVYLNPAAFPRAFIVHKAIFENNEQAYIEAVGRIKKEFATTVAILHEGVAEIQSALLETPASDSSTADITKYSPNEVIVSTNMVSPGFLVLGDAFHPDWKAWVDGRPSKIFIANYLIRSVFLTEGKHTVRFSFEPASYYWGAALSLVSFLAAIFLLFRRRLHF